MILMKENQNQYQFPPFTISNDHTSSLSCAILLDPPQEEANRGQDQTNDNFSNNQHIIDGKQQAKGSSKWMSSKMRLMKKMMGTDQILVKKQRRKQVIQDQAQMNHASCSSSNSPSDVLRVCSTCKTTKTPLWRSGPQGPKTLCNACGIRQMKARRAMRAAAAATAAASGSSTGLLPVTNCKMQEEKVKSSDHVDRTVPFKKRFKIVASASPQKQLRFDDITVHLSKKLALHQTFPQEEKDAAILLMALSCGLIHG